MMFRLMGSEQHRSTRIVFAVISGILLLSGLFTSVMIQAVNGDTKDTIVLGVLTVIFCLCVVITGYILHVSRQANLNPEKQKGVLDGQDMYALIDRMIEDLDENEITYLQQRLDSRLFYMDQRVDQLKPPAEKQKPLLDGVDMYALIDRMIEDLDEDEIAYLQQQLANRLYADKQDLRNTLGDLLDQRAENRLRE